MSYMKVGPSLWGKQNYHKSHLWPCLGDQVSQAVVADVPTLGRTD